MTKEESKIKETSSKNDKYNEKRIIQQFLNSKQGISFLTEKGNEEKINNFMQSKKKKLPFDKIVEELIDFYVTWAESMPIRKNFLSAYELFKLIEKNCDTKEVKELFNYLIKED